MLKQFGLFGVLAAVQGNKVSKFLALCARAVGGIVRELRCGGVGGGGQILSLNAPRPLNPKPIP